MVPAVILRNLNLLAPTSGISISCVLQQQHGRALMVAAGHHDLQLALGTLARSVILMQSHLGLNLHDCTHFAHLPPAPQLAHAHSPILILVALGCSGMLARSSLVTILSNMALRTMSGAAWTLGVLSQPAPAPAPHILPSNA